jgi:hypothetical protein
VQLAIHLAQTLEVEVMAFARPQNAQPSGPRRRGGA